MVLSVSPMHLSDSSGEDAASRRLNMDRRGRTLRRKPIVDLSSEFVRTNEIIVERFFDHYQSLWYNTFLVDSVRARLAGRRYDMKSNVRCCQLYDDSLSAIGVARGHFS